MHSTFSFFLLAPLLLLSFLTYLSLSLALTALYAECNTTGNYTTNSTYETNLESLLSSLSTESVIAVGFSKNTTGAAPNQVYGLILCRGDTNYTYCSSCIDQVTQDAAELCPNTKQAIIWYDYCMLHYSNEEIISSSPNNSLELLMYNTQNVSSDILSGWNESSDNTKSTFTLLVASLLNGTSAWAADESMERLFSTGMMSIPSFQVIYGLAQCIPDMSNSTCYECLAGLVDEIRSIFDGRQGARILGDRCALRYEIYKFFFGDALYVIDSSSPSPPTTSSPPSSSPQGEKCRLILSSCRFPK